jgi:prolyl oligopeptidase
MKKYILLLLALISISQIIKAQDDKYLWLEEVDGKKALQFVEKQNNATISEF